MFIMADVIGFVFHVTKYESGNMEIGFYDKDKDATIYYSTGKSKGSFQRK